MSPVSHACPAGDRPRTQSPQHPRNLTANLPLRAGSSPLARALLLALLTLALVLPTAASAAKTAAAQPVPAADSKAETPAKAAPDTGGTQPEQAGPFSFDTVIAKAEALAQDPYQPAAPLSEPLASLNYDAWREIRFKPELSFWRPEKLPFELQLFHLGGLYTEPVALHVVQGDKVSNLEVGKELFDYRGSRDVGDRLPDILQAAGFRVHAPINIKDYYDEFLVFLGASYFRAVNKGTGYGLSARGLAVDTATAGGEEFPSFREFWIEKPKPGDKRMRIWALLDSPSVTGAYAFTAQPGPETVVEVSARLFMRQSVEKLGVAPVSSMFFFGENQPSSPRRDWRPEVHDSDGLLVHMASGEWLWRPLRNPATLQVSRLEARNVQGFGLLQRDRDFADYEDLESRYENRPSLWIEPLQGWGKGFVELVEIPSDQEFHDNIAMYWTPANQPQAGQALELGYRMRWFSAAKDLPPGGQVTATRVGRISENTWQFVLDFSGPELDKLPADADVDAEITAPEGSLISERQVYKNTVSGGWRLAFKLHTNGKSALERMLPDKDAPIELRAFLKNKNDVVSETWSYGFKPDTP